MITADKFPQSVKVDNAIAYKEGREAGSNMLYKSLIEVIPTTASAKIEVFYGDKGRLRRWRGERQPQSFGEYKMTLTLDEWEYTHAFKKTVLEDDQSGGILRNKATNFGRAVDSSLEMETMEFITHTGLSVTCFDGAMFYSASHVWRDSSGATVGSVQSNLQRGGSQLDATTFYLTAGMFAGFQSDKSKALGCRLTDVVVKRGSLNAKTGRELSNSQYTVEASTSKGQFTTNIFNGAFNLHETDYGLGASEWIALDLSDPEMKPVKVLSHVNNGFDNLEFTQLLEDSESGFWRNQLAFGVYGRFDWNPGYWFTAIFYGASDYAGTVTDNGRQRVSYPNS